MHDQSLVRPLLQQVREEAVDEPLAARDDGGAQSDPDEALVELVDLFDPWPPREGRRALGQDSLHRPNEILAALAVGDEELDRQLLQPFRQHPDGGDLRVRDLDRLAVERAQLRAAQRDVLDDTLQLERRDRDRVSDRVPALDEHHRAGDDVHQYALDRKAREDDHERRAGERGELVQASGQLRGRQDDRNREGGVGDRGADHRDRRFAPLDVGDPEGDGCRGRLGVAVVPEEDLAGNVSRAARDQPRSGEQADHGEKVQHVEHRFVKLAAALNPYARPVSTSLPPLNVGQKRRLMWQELAQRLEGRMIVLDPIREEHREPLRAAAADPAIWRWMQVDGSTPEGFDAWFAHACAKPRCSARLPS